ncbi:MAG: hypothetical protein II779_05295 [Clostridia bacterium]|nr:hypothetical protein [Clostridia bacterium]
MEYIEATQAAAELIRQRNIMIGIMTVSLVLIALAAWGIIMLSEQNVERRIQKAVEKCRTEMKSQYADDKKRLGADYFAAKMVLKDELERERQRRTFAEDQLNETIRANQRLREELASVPAGGARVKRIAER